MANLKEIRLRIRSVKTTQQVTKAMKMVAAAKLRRAQDNILKLRPYALKLSEIISNVTGTIAEGYDSPFAKARPVEKVLLVVITSNRGLCGAFNTNIIKLALNAIQERFSAQAESGNLQILCIGKKGYDFFSKRKYSMVGENHDLFSGLSFEKVSETASMVMDGYASGKWDQVVMFYNEFKNVVVQNRKAEVFLPLQQVTTGAGSSASSDYIYEPSCEEILDDLIPKSLRLSFYRAVLESNASEQGARMNAMDSATNNAEELVKQLMLTYNSARQAAITKEILEIVAGAEALASK